MLLLYSVCLLLLASLPLLMVVKNLRDFTRAAADVGAAPQPVSVLIPARNEEAGIVAAITSVLAASEGQAVELIVLDDHSTDRTAELVQSIASREPRVRLIQPPALPEGWNGKQHACWHLSQAASHDVLVFMDADVRLTSKAVQRMVHELDERKVSLLSGFPHQQTPSFSEAMLIPMMYVVLLSYLPLDRMRATRDARFGAGCGQLFIARRADYVACGGHQAIRGSRHDGLQLPRLFRSAGFATDLFDASDLAEVRMYCGVQQVTRGLLKNATEGMAQMPLLAVFSVLLLGGYVLPLFSLAHALYWEWSIASIGVLALATVFSLLPRFLIERRVRLPLVGAFLQPVAVLWFVILQWYAYIHSSLGFAPIPWRGRA